MKLRDIIGQSFYVQDNSFEPNLKKKDWYEITSKSDESNLTLRRVGTSKVLSVPTKSFIEGHKKGHFLFIEEM